MTTFGFILQLIGRSLAWGLAGMAMGLGQGIALRSKRLLLYGFLGGVVGGLFGGLLFDPIDQIFLGPDKPSSHWSRLIGFGVIGLSVGVMIGVVELLARDAWLRMTQGPLTGKEFLLFKDVMNIGSSPRSDIYLFNDAQVADHHAMIRAVGDECEIEARQRTHPVLLNNRTVQTARLRHGDNVTIGRTSFVFQRRKG
jgi:type III secretion system (T3SS) inner membrane Yop/YscD-like protein